MSHADRNIIICQLYQGGATLEQLAERFGKKRERIRQIVKAGGLTKDNRATNENFRLAFVGINVTDKVKVALQDEAKRRGLSVSSLSSQALKRMLVELGYAMGTE